MKKDPNFDGQSLSSIADYFKNNGSVIKIKEKYETQENSFSFALFSKEDIPKPIKSSSSNEASLIEDNPITILKNSIHIYSEKLTNIFNECLINGEFPNTLKTADVTPIFKGGSDNEKESYYPMSMLLTFSKVFEKLLFKQVNDHMQSKFSKHLTGFRKNHSTQNVLLIMIEKWKAILNKKLKVGAPFMDLSKVFDTLHHCLLLPKLSAYGFDNNSLSFVRSYLTNIFQRCKIENHFSYWREITTCVIQRSVLGPLAFNIFINGIFLFVENSNVYNYADDNTLLAFGKTFDRFTRKLQNDFLILDEWFFNNFLVPNSDKYHFMTLGTPNTLPNFKFENIAIKNSTSQKLLGIIIENKLYFTEHFNTVCKKANLKLHDLNIISISLSPEQHVVVINAYIQSLFNYCSLVWKFCYRGIMYKMNKIHERSLRLLLENYKDDFQDLLRSSGDISIYQRCINSFLTKVYKYIHGLSSKIMNDVLSIIANIYNTRQFNVFETDILQVHIPTPNKYGLKSIPDKAKKLWNLLSDNQISFPSLTR